MLDVVQQNLFDYASLDTNTRAFVQEKAQAIHTRLKHTAEDIIAIGQDLVEVKARLGHGQFMDWVSAEFDMGYHTAVNFMQVAQRFGGKNRNFLDLPISVLYALAKPSTPDTVIEMVETGQIPTTLSAIREAKHVDPATLPTLESESGPIYGPVYTSPDATTALFQGSQLLKNLTSIPIETKEDEGDSTVITPVEIDRGSHHEDPLPVVNRGAPAALQSSDSNEWYTPWEYIGAARKLMGSIDLDPASNELANQVVQASTYFDISTNGLTQEWTGHIWLNPPYGYSYNHGSDYNKSNQEIWTRRLIQQYDNGNGPTTEAVLLVNANTEAKWFQPLYEFLICFTNHRIKFYNTSGESSQPTQGNALVYLGKNKAGFIEIFSQFGVVVRRADGR